MQIEKAIKHFHYKLSSVWKATDPDIKAFGSIRDYFVLKNKEQLNDNKLFAKLYIYVYADFLKRYNATVFDDIPQKELHKMLNMPLDAFIESFTNQLNESSLYELFDRVGLRMVHPATVSDEDKAKESEILKNLPKEDKDLFREDVWKKEDVRDNLEAMINSALNELK